MSDVNPHIDELASRMEALRSEIEELAAIEEPTVEQSERFDRAADEFESVRVEHEQMAERAVRAERARTIMATKPQQVERGFSAPQVSVRTDPYENPEAIRSGVVDYANLSGRARQAVDSDRILTDEQKDAAWRRAENPLVARHMLLTGSPSYRSAFAKWIRNPQAAMLTNEEGEAVRAAMSTTAGNGGYMIPQQLDPTIILTNDGTANPFRAVARVEQGTSNQWEGVASSGVSAGWASEAAEATDNSPTVTAPTVVAHRAQAYLFGSYEVLQDTNFEQQLPRLLGDAKDRLESAAFAVGSGSTAPFGVVTATTAVTTSRVTPTTGGTFTTASVADVYKVIQAIPPRHRSKSTWVANFAILNTIRQMSASGQGSSFWANLGANMPEQLLGRPVYEASEMVSAITTGSNILLAGDFSEFLIYDRIGMQLVYDPLVLGSNRIPTGQGGFYAFWRTGANALNPNAFRVLKL